MKEQRSLLSSSAVVSCNQSLSKNVCRALSNRADGPVFKEHLPLYGGEGWKWGSVEKQRAGRWKKELDPGPTCSGTSVQCTPKRKMSKPTFHTCWMLIPLQNRTSSLPLEIPKYLRPFLYSIISSSTKKIRYIVIYIYMWNKILQFVKDIKL